MQGIGLIIIDKDFPFSLVKLPIPEEEIGLNERDNY